MANLKLALVNPRRRERNVRERVDLIELQQAHRMIGSNGHAYNRAAQLPARAAMMQRWAGYPDTPRIAAQTSFPFGR